MTSVTDFDLKAYIKARATLVDAALERFLPRGEDTLGGVGEMMRYAMFPGGKRFRPVLTVATAEALGFDAGRVMPTACAFEMIHGFSLVHDDLPCMDDDAERRGKPSCHVRFGEAEALLAGDALSLDAFRLVAANARVSDVRPDAVIRVVEELSEASGFPGMVGGQLLDIHGMRADSVSAEALVGIHRAKTGALIRGSVRAGAILCDATEPQLAALTGYAERLGLVFQITDDLLDYGEKEETASYPVVFGVEESRRLARVATEEGLDCLKGFPESAEPLRALARYLLSRET
ncbi:MAG: polyprenyl synthetase family protein [Armatimonadetes bacterium]|nr:polyprenyl synthetase family protein [Armatimonadota bacterium]